MTVDLLAAIPTLEAVSELCSAITFDNEEEAHFSILVTLINMHAISMLSLFELLERERVVLDAFRESNRQTNTGLDQNNTGSGS